jgi:hypothetical protein
MSGGTRASRVAGVAVAGIGLVGLGVFAGLLATWVPAAASGDEHRGGDALLPLLFVGLPAGLAGLVVTVAGARLWRGHRVDAWLGWIAALGAGAVAVNGALGYGNVLWALGVVLTQPGRWWLIDGRFVHDPTGDALAMGTPMSALPSAAVLDPWFLLPGILAVLAAVALAGLVAMVRHRQAPQAGAA